MSDAPTGEPSPGGPAASGPVASGTAYPRPLTGREREVLELMVTGLPEGHPARGEVGTALVTGSCGCGLCPSIELSPGEGLEGVDRLVVSAGHDDAVIVLFVDGGHLSYLEAAPLADERPVRQFPPAAQIIDVGAL